MAKVKPLEGLVFNKEKVGDMAKVVAPPYDVIGSEMQSNLYERHENNVVRLILGKQKESDTDTDSRYTRSAEDFNSWKESGVLKTDGPTIYFYVQKFTSPDGREVIRRGFLARFKIEDYGDGGIHAHERTLSGPKTDRLNLTKACKANFSPIFGLFVEYNEGELINDILDKAKTGDPFVDAVGDDGVSNLVWAITDSSVIEQVSKLMEDKDMFIADGHHRYDTALNYRNLMREANPDFTGDEPYNFVLMYFASMADKGLEIYPIHRVVHSLSLFDVDSFLEKCQEFFHIDELQFEAANETEMRGDLIKRLEDKGDNIRFGVYVGGTQSYLIFTLKSKKIMDDVFGTDMPEVYKTLDVSILHTLVLDKLLGIDKEAQAKQTNILYRKDLPAALGEINSGSGQIAFIMNPTQIGQVREVSEAGLLMPQKSTFFYPKILSGLVINPLSDD